MNSLTKVYALYKKKLRIGGSHSTRYLSRKSSLDEHLECFVEDSSFEVSLSDIAADPLLSSFFYNPPPADEPESLQSSFTTEAKLAEKSSDKSVIERYEIFSILFILFYAYEPLFLSL